MPPAGKRASESTKRNSAHMTKRESRNSIIRHLHDEVYCRIGISNAHGVGVFAVRRIPKNIQVLRSTLSTQDIRVSKSSLRHLPRATRRLLQDFCEHDSRFYWLPRHGLNALSLYQYLNHSTDPNVSLIRPGFYRTLRAIRGGEELTLNYDLAFCEKHIFAKNKKSAR
ncbi:MAG: SET domain-containing protein [Gammaproteobacteria bacterium]|nr:SET domain-containing protein [Gammaproteobacteria bacterium]MBM4231616.1 SET domain-containing protein [Gammaproteobacteria bacterium]